MKNFVAIVKGVSASGKSSRVYQLFLFLEKEVEFSKELFYYVNSEGKKRQVGVLFPEVNLLFIGKEYETGGVKRWQGYDSVTSSFVNSAGFSEFLKEQIKETSIIVEGAGVTQTNRLRPKFLFEELGIENVYIQYYNFLESEKDKYEERLILRSGSVPPKGTMWDKCRSYNKEHSKSIKESEDLTGKGTFEVFWDSYDTPIFDFGLKFMIICMPDIFCEDLELFFLEFVEKYDYQNKNTYINFQNNGE